MGSDKPFVDARSDTFTAMSLLAQQCGPGNGAGHHPAPTANFLEQLGSPGLGLQVIA